MPSAPKARAATKLAAAFKAVDAHRIAADCLGLQGVPHRGAFMNDLCAKSFQRRHILLGVPAGGLHDSDPALFDGRDIFRVGRGGERRKKGQVHAERPAGHIPAALDFFRKQLRRLLRQARNDPEAPSIRNRGGQPGEADIMHAALYYRVLDAEELCNPCPHVNLSL
jgi:hypothetical protein